MLKSCSEMNRSNNLQQWQQWTSAPCYVTASGWNSKQHFETSIAVDLPDRGKTLNLTVHSHKSWKYFL